MMKMKYGHSIIGSKLFAHLFPDNLKIQKRCSGNKDTDILLFVDYTDSIQMKDVYKQVYGSKTELHFIPDLNCYFENGLNGLPNITTNSELQTFRNMFFTLKASHYAWDTVHREKTIYDLFLMSEEGCKIIPELYYELHNYWTKKWGEKWRADFTKESEDFFDDAISRENIHDELHERVKYFDKPAFKYLQEEGQTTVYVDEKKFYEADELIRQRVIIEEAQTLALERFLIPGIKKNQHTSYYHFIKALIERLAPLWMTVYIIENLNYFLTYKENYYDSKI